MPSFKPFLLAALLTALFSTVAYTQQKDRPFTSFFPKGSTIIYDTISSEGVRVNNMAETGGVLNSFSQLPVTTTTNSFAARTYSVTGAITLDITVFPSSCNYPNGTIIINASGGTAPYTYSFQYGWTQNTGFFPERAPGTYKFTVTDATGQSVTTDIIVANTLPGPKLRYVSSTKATDCVSGDATVTVEATGGTPPYEYSIDLINFQSGNTFTNLSNGAYNFHVRDANGCMATLPGFNYTWNLSCGLSLGMGHAGSTCDPNGFILITAQDPAYAPYTYSLNGGPFETDGNWETGLPAGIHTVHIKDKNGKIYLVMVSIALYCGIGIESIAVDAACQQADGSITINAAGGTLPYTYTIDGINYQSSNVFTNLAPGRYPTVIKDANGFTKAGFATVYDRCPVVSLTSSNETCARNNGSITATAEKGTAPYEYSIDGTNFQSSNIFTGLAAGNYTVTLKDALGFTSTASTEVKYYCLSVTAVATNVVCGNSNGTITATGSMGTPPYRYSINGNTFQVSNVFNGLAAGGYTVTIRDNIGQTATTAVQITDAPAPQIAVNSTPALCAGNNGTITITGNAGTAPLQYSINGTNYQSSTIFNTVAPGNYTAYVKDANGCIASNSITVQQNCPAITTAVVNETCGNANGTITVTVTNTPDFGPYQYSLDGMNFQSSNVFTGLRAGNYTITVKDALNFLHTVSAGISNNCPVVTVTVINETCGNANAVITASGSNGIAPYAFSIDGINYQSSTVFNGLSAGSYTVYIKDAGGSVQNTGATVINIAGPQLSIQSVTAASCINNDGALSLSASGGTSAFQYSLDGNNFQSSNSFINKASGNYTATVKDANGCLATVAVVIPLSDNLTLQAGNDLTICEGEGVSLPATSNGTGFVWSPAATLNNATVFHPIASPSVTTKYYVTASLGICSKIDSLIVSVNAAPVANAGKDSIICYGKDIQLTGSGGVKYEWSPSTYLNDLSIADPMINNPTSTITYSLYVTDNNNCRSLQPDLVKITVTPPAKVFAGNDTAIVMNQPFTLRGTDINNSGFIDYSWSPSYGLNNSAVPNPVVLLDRDMTYTLTAATISGCKGVDEVNVKVYKGPEIYVPTAFTPNNDGLNDILKAIPVGIKEFRYFVVFNRWGQRVFYTNDANKGWDGKLSGTEQGNDSFTWMAEGVDDKGNKVVRKGTVVIVR